MLSLNMDDLQRYIQMLSGHLTALGIALAAALIVTIVVGFMKKLGKPAKKLVRTNAWIAFILVVVIVVNLMLTGPMNTIVNLATGNGSISEESIEEAYAYNNEIAGEGMTLLENNGTLPLANGAKVNLFGWASTNPVYGGVGSGALNTQYATTSLLDAFKQSGFEVNQELVDFYTNYCAARPAVGMWAQDWTLPEPNVSDYSEELLANAKAFSDTAIVTISRPGGENADLPWDMVSVVNGSWIGKDAYTANSYFNGVYDDSVNAGNDWDAGDHYLELSNREEEMLDMVCKNFDKVVVIVNTNNAMELGFLEKYDVDAALYAPCPGQNGFSAVGEILNGSINPSGRTVDTWVYDLKNTPTFNNFGQFHYNNADEFTYVSTSWLTGEETTAIPMFVKYVEGIYVGYKFYETAAAEGLINYDECVAYPFGYGLSYTSFTQEMSNFTENDGVISFDVTVTNTGDVAGKDVVEVYFNPPYYNGGIEKASANLITFAKTAVIEPGASEVVSISFKAEDMASYDEYGNKAYVLEHGDYVISVNADSHTVLDSETYTVVSDVVYRDGRSTDLVAATNQFEDAKGDVTYLSRADQFANYAEATAAPTDYAMSAEVKAAFINNATYNPSEHNNADDVMPTQGAKGDLQLVNLRGLDYDDPKWEELLNQLTVDEMETLIALGGYQTAPIESIGKVNTYDCDGPASINNNFTGQGSIGFCGAVMLGFTWNTDCTYKFGTSIGRMADELETSGWYAPAMNNHRTAFSGRNFEYYSEDGVLAGYMSAAAIQGAEEYGVYAYIKHFALNDQETGRNTMLCTWSNEQAIREIYLKPFEIAVKVGGADAVMSSFNYIGTTWAGGNNALLNKVLREEWGFVGMVLTDYFGVYGYMNADQAIRNGNDFCLVNYETGANRLVDKESATSVIAMRQAAKNILYTVVNSRAYAEENLHPGMPAWQIMMILADIIIVALLALWEVKLIKKVKKAKAEAVVSETETESESK